MIKLVVSCQFHFTRARSLTLVRYVFNFLIHHAIVTNQDATKMLFLRIARVNKICCRPVTCITHPISAWDCINSWYSNRKKHDAQLNTSTHRLRLIYLQCLMQWRSSARRKRSACYIWTFPANVSKDEAISIRRMGKVLNSQPYIYACQALGCQSNVDEIPLAVLKFYSTRFFWWAY